MAKIVRFTDPQFPDVVVLIRKPNQQVRSFLYGEMYRAEKGVANIGDIAGMACQKHVAGWEGLEREFGESKHIRTRMPAELQTAVLAFMVNDCVLSEDDEGNSDSSSD